MGAAHKRTCGVQVARRGTGRSAVHSGASAGCCGQTGHFNVTRSRWKNHLDVHCNTFFSSHPPNSDFGEFHLQHGATLSPFCCFSPTAPSKGQLERGGNDSQLFLPAAKRRGGGGGARWAQSGVPPHHPATPPPSLADVIWAQASARPLRLQYATPL